MTSREKIENTCRALEIKIISLTYDPAVTYTSGGWDITVKKEGYDEEVYGAHGADELIRELRAEFPPEK